MARALSLDAKLIIMDEPSAVLDAGEVGQLFRVIREITDQGVAVIYISHRLEEIRDIGDRMTVLKDGRTVHVFVEHAIGSLERPMQDKDLEAKFHSLADPVIGQAKSDTLIEACWTLAGAKDVRGLTDKARP